MNDRITSPPDRTHPAGGEKATFEREVERRSGAKVEVVYEAVRREGEEELARPTSALFWSGLAGGLAMGLSLVADGVLRSYLPHENWAGAVARLGYVVGFVIVILGRQQLYTENTLKVVLPVLQERTARSLGQMLRVWGVVLLANLLGAAALSWVAADTAVFSHEMKAAFAEVGRKAIEPSFGTVLLRAILAGWIIALIVWLIPAAEGSARLWVIVLLSYLVGVAHLSHVIAGSGESMYLVWAGEISWGRYLGGFLVPAFLGNTIGGVGLTALVNHAQVSSGERKPGDSSSGTPG